MICVAFLFSKILLVFIFPCFMISFLYYLTQDGKIISLQCDKKTEWVLRFSHADSEPAILLGSSVMLSHLMILHFKLPDNSKQKTIVLFSDGFSREEFRALRRCVRMGYL